jgi:hypothetical protein
MKPLPVLVFVSLFCFAACTDKKSNEKSMVTENTSDLSCKLTTPELQKRKATVLADLQKHVLEKKELENGYAFKFSGSDATVDALVEFAKSERACCDFFDFNLALNGDTSAVWFTITGPKGAKEFIKTEMEL